MTPLWCVRRVAAATAVALAAAGIPAGLRAQGSGAALSGRVVEARSGAPVPYLTVQLRSARDSAFVAGRLTDSAGAFTFPGVAKGAYVLDARRVGYLPLRQPVFVGELSPYLDLGPLALVPAPRVLADVVVTADADEVASAMDRTTYRVADNIAQAGGSVVQAMAALPGVTVTQDGTIQLRGSDKVAVLIDGKQTALTGVAAQRGLENLPASAIERIEVITAPGASRDANASAGIVNLVLRKASQDGVHGRLGVTGGAGALWETRANLPGMRPQRLRTPKVNPSFAVTRRDAAGSAYVQGDWLHAPTLNRNEFATRTYDDGTAILQQLLRNRRTDVGTLAAGMDRVLDARRSLSVSGLVSREAILDDGDNPYFRGSLADRVRLWQFREDEVKYTAVGSAVLTRRFAQPGHAVTVTGLYSFHREDEKYDFTNTLPASTGRDAFALLSDEHVWDLAADYVRPLARGRLELGLKGRYRTIPVDMRFFPGPRSPIDSGAGGWATYRERIPAVYATYVHEGPRLEVEGGLRVETVRVAYDVNPGHNTYRSDGYRYLQPFPTARVAWKLDDDRKVSLFLTRRVDRPNEVDIRIFPKYDEPELIKVGNPGLRPQFTTALDLGYKASWRDGSLYAAAFHRVVDGTIVRIATPAPGSPILYHVFQNAGRSATTGTEVVWQQAVSAVLSLSTNATAYRTTIGAYTVVNRYPVPVPYSAEAASLVSGNLKVNAMLRGGGGWEGRITSVYLAPDLFPQGRIGSRYSLDVGVRWPVSRGRGEFVANATDLLNTARVRRSITGAGFRYESTDHLETQVVRVGYTWKY